MCEFSFKSGNQRNWGILRHDLNRMETTGKAAKKIGLDPKTLRKYASLGLVPGFRNPFNGFWYFDLNQVRKALGLQKGS